VAKLAALMMALSGFISAHGAQARVIAESDTGIIASGPMCRMTGHEILDTWLDSDFFDYLSATVRIRYQCVNSAGEVFATTSQDTVVFPTLVFDWALQAWTIGGRVIAYDKPFGRIPLEADFSSIVWIDAQSDHLAIRVLILDECGEQQRDCA